MAGAIMGLEQFAEALEWQARHAERNGAPATARVIRALAKLRDSDTATGRRIANWQGLTLKDALPLRVTGGLHHLVLTGADRRLERVYAGQVTAQEEIDALVCELAQSFDTLLLPWLDRPPQTNEAGRSASIMAGLLWLARRAQPRFALFETGASAGVNTMLDRFAFRLGETEVGPAGSIMRIEPEWRGTSPPAPPEGFAIDALSGCDLAPIDLADPEAALRLKAYVWPDAPGRLARIDAAIALASECAPEVARMDADAFVEQQLDRPQTVGTTCALFHSIMWQYLPAATQDAISARMEAAGAEASEERPLAWLALETDPETFAHDLTVRLWDGGEHRGQPVKLARAHPHGAWVEWLGGQGA
ncbi:MAG: DUF2332 domain-containing protein [Erythrobacter sp.]|uniref:DUF2332 domain-containing protein n=1 Tax=Erythrobacter sp. TaxID=1042 RepID=UPI0032F088E2